MPNEVAEPQERRRSDGPQVLKQKLVVFESPLGEPSSVEIVCTSDRSGQVILQGNPWRLLGPCWN